MYRRLKPSAYLKYMHKNWCSKIRPTGA